MKTFLKDQSSASRKQQHNNNKSSNFATVAVAAEASL
jgi:hypothetical protein